MATFIETLPKFTNEYGQEAFEMSPGAKSGDEYLDGYVRVEWFKTVFPAIANATLPLADDKYEALKAIGDFWKINAINWRKNGTIEMNIPADEIVQEEEDFLLAMYPPVEEQPTEEA
jgi:hypothetical protein